MDDYWVKIGSCEESDCV